MRVHPRIFDQEGQYWRALRTAGNFFGAAALQLDYIRECKDLIDESDYPIEALWFHVGQVVSCAGVAHAARATEFFYKSFREPLEDHVPWNAYVAAVIGFHERDCKRMEAAIVMFDSTKERSNWPRNREIIDELYAKLVAGDWQYE